MAKVNKDVADWFKKAKQTFAPNLIKGDFDCVIQCVGSRSSAFAAVR